MLRFPLADSRTTKDLDLIYTESFATWESEFKCHLASGVSGFRGKLIVRGKETFKERKATALPPGFTMMARNVQLYYRDYKREAFANLPLDITAATVLDQKSELDFISIDKQELVDSLGLSFTVNQPARFLSLENQAAQKAGTLFYSANLRPGDIKDLDLIFNRLQQLGQIDTAQFGKLIIIDLHQRGIQKESGNFAPLHMDELKKVFLASGFGDAATFDRVTSLVMEAVAVATGQSTT